MTTGSTALVLVVPATGTHPCSKNGCMAQQAFIPSLLAYVSAQQAFNCFFFILSLAFIQISNKLECVVWITLQHFCVDNEHILECLLSRMMVASSVAWTFPCVLLLVGSRVPQRIVGRLIYSLALLVRLLCIRLSRHAFDSKEELTQVTLGAS